MFSDCGVGIKRLSIEFSIAIGGRQRERGSRSRSGWCNMTKNNLIRGLPEVGEARRALRAGVSRKGY